MTEIEERILLNQVAIMESLDRIGDGECTTIDLEKAYQQTVKFIKEQRKIRKNKMAVKHIKE